MSAAVAVAAPAVAAEPSSAAGEVVSAPSAAASPRCPLFGRPTIVELTDGRQLEGRLVAFDSGENILLQNVIEYKPFVSTVDKQLTVTKRTVGSIVVPLRFIKALLQRDAKPEDATESA